MKTIVPYFLILIFLFSIAARAADTNPPPRLTVELRDGSRVVGDSGEKYFKFQSALLGEIKLATADIRSIDCVATNSAKLTTVNGDVLTVWFVNPELRVNTGFGKVELSVASLRRMSVSAARRSGQAREGLVLFWSGTGDGKNNIGTDPDTLPSLSPSGIVKVANNPDLVSMQQTRQLTYEAWIKPNSIPHEFPVMLSKGGNQPGGAYGGYEFHLNVHGDHDLSLESGNVGYGTQGGWINNHLGEWIHIAFTVNDQTKTAEVYVNGQATVDIASYGSNDDINFNLSNDLYIGTPDPVAHPNRARFDGEMRDVKLFNRVLTAEEIHADYEAGHPN